jgi:hypothetical protein
MPDLKIKLTNHAVKQFRKRIFPDSTVKECRQFLQENVTEFKKVTVNPKKDGTVIVDYNIKGKCFRCICILSQHKHILRVLTILAKH